MKKKKASFRFVYTAVARKPNFRPKEALTNFHGPGKIGGRPQKLLKGGRIEARKHF
jgi:hypothetical protein